MQCYVLVQGRNTKCTGLKFSKHCPLFLLLKVSFKHLILKWIHIVHINLVQGTKRQLCVFFRNTDLLILCKNKYPVCCKNHQKHMWKKLRVSSSVRPVHTCLYIIYISSYRGWFIYLSIEESKFVFRSCLLSQLGLSSRNITSHFL